MNRLGTDENGRNTGINTGIYYALDKTLDRIEAIYNNTIPSVFSEDKKTWYHTKYYIILITDGLDNVSVELAKKNDGKNYATMENYLNKLQGRIKKLFSSKRGNTLEIYPLIILGDDLKMSGYADGNALKERFKDDWRIWYPKGKSLAAPLAREPIVREVNTTGLNELYEAFQHQFWALGFQFQLPKGYAEEKYRIRMEFRRKNEADFSAASPFFTADFVKQSGKFVLKNLNPQNGLSFKSGKFSLANPENSLTYKNAAVVSAAEGEPEESLLANFILDDLKIDDKTIEIPSDGKDWTRQWYWKDGDWRFNSEYREKPGWYQNACVFILLDRSKSIDGGSEAAPSTADRIPFAGRSIKRDTEDLAIQIMRWISEEHR
jgi:hypothetical protein